MKKLSKPSSHKQYLRSKGHYVKPHDMKCRFLLCDPKLMNELTLFAEQHFQRWAKEIKGLLEKLNAEFVETDLGLSTSRMNEYRRQYRKLIKKGIIESVEPSRLLKRCKDEQIKRSRSQILLDRLREYENSIFTFRRGDTTH